MTIIKNLLKSAVNKCAYPHARIGFASRVVANTVLGTNVEIGRGCYLHDSILGNNVRVEDDCNIFASKLADNVLVNRRCTISNIELGSYSYIAEQSQLSYAKIGRFCSIGPELLCGYGTHPLDFISTSPVFYSTRKQCGTTFADENAFDESKHTTIGHDVWIGARVFVRDGVNLGNGAVIAAGAVVVADVSDYAVMGGVPAKVIRYRFSESVIKDLLQLEWWNWPETDLRTAQALFAQNDVQRFLDWAQQR